MVGHGASVLVAAAANVAIVGSVLLCFTRFYAVVCVVLANAEIK